MAYSAKLLKQLGRPSGLLGWLILRRLNRVNRGMNDLTCKALALGGADRVLDVGFGGGALISRILAETDVPFVGGAEVSDLSLATAKRRFRNAVDAGRLDLRACTESTLPFEDGSFSKVCSVNVIYFWPDAPRMIAELFRVLSGGGRCVLCYAEGAPDRVNAFPPEAVERYLKDAGFLSPVTTHGEDEENGTYHCTVATKP